MIRHAILAFLISFALVSPSHASPGWFKGKAFELDGAIQKIQSHYIKISSKKVYTRNATWLDEYNKSVSSQSFTVGDLVLIEGKKWRNLFFAKTIKLARKPDDGKKKVALLFVGHGEPVVVEDGDVPITLADGTPFGPHAASLNVPEEYQYTEWAAAYEEIATAMSYIFGDLNGNGILHELAMVPSGDVPGFFTWDIFHADVNRHYEAIGNFSPHNDILHEHINSLDIDVAGASIDIYLAFLDAVPRISDVAWEIANANKYQELVVVPLLVASSTHTQEIADLVEEAALLTSGMEVLVTEPFFEVPFMRKRLRDAVVAMADYVRTAIPADVPDSDIGVLLASHGTPFVPPYPEFGYADGDIFSNLIITEDAFHEEIGKHLPWKIHTGRMNYSTPSIADSLDAFEADGFTHVMVIPSAFPTAALHTMWDVAKAASGGPLLPEEGIVESTLGSCMTVYYSSEGFADIPTGRSEFRKGLAFLGKLGVLEALKEKPKEEMTPYVACQPDELCVTITSDMIIDGELRLLLYDASTSDWPQDFSTLPEPDWVIAAPLQMADPCTQRIRIPLENLIIPVAADAQPQEGTELGLVVASGEGTEIDATDLRGYSLETIIYQSGHGANFGTLEVLDPPQNNICLVGEICVTVDAQATTGPDLKLMLYRTTEEQWPQDFYSLPTPTAVVVETIPVPETFPIHIRIPLADNLFTFSGALEEGAQVGLTVVTGVAANFVVEPTDARGFSTTVQTYEAGAAMNYGQVELTVPAGDPCDLNPYNPSCLTGPLFWREHFLGQEDFVPGAIYLDLADLDGDNIKDIVMVGEPHFEDPEIPLTALRLGVYYLNDDLTVRESQIIDEWSEADQAFYSPWGVRVIEHSGSPMIIVGCNIPGLAPLENGSGAVFSYRLEDTTWVRSIVRENPDPTVTNYNAMIVVPADIDNDGDDDLALSGAFATSAMGSWMENTGDPNNPWIPHLTDIAPGTDPYIRGTLAYKSADLNGDGYPEVVYNAMFDVANTDPPLYRGEIWLGVNPGPTGWNEPWPMVVIDNDNWAAADMWFHDFDDDGSLDLVANQIFDSTVTIYHHPGANGLFTSWFPEVIISGLKSPSDMWLADMDKDGLMDVVSADHTAHKGIWHKNPGPGSNELWLPNLIFRNIRLPGDFAMDDIDNEGDLDWVGTSMTLGQGFIMEQVKPDTSLVTSISLPEGFEGQISSLLVTLATNLPVTGPPAATLVQIQNVDSDENGINDVDEILNGSRDLVLGVEDVALVGDYHVVIALFMEGGGIFAPVPGIDYMASSILYTFGQGQVAVDLELELVPVP